MNLENSPDWRAKDHEDAVSASIDVDDDEVRVFCRPTPMDDYGEEMPKPDVVEMPLETARNLVVWLGERLGTSSNTVVELEALLVGIRTELRHLQRVRDNNANALAQLCGTQYGHSFPRMLEHLEELVPYLRATHLDPATARFLDTVLDAYDPMSGIVSEREVKALRAELARVGATVPKTEPEAPYSEPAEALRGKVIEAGRKIRCAIGPLMPNGQPKDAECACDPCTFRRELWQSYADLFRMDTIFDDFDELPDRDDVLAAFDASSADTED